METVEDIEAVCSKYSIIWDSTVHDYSLWSVSVPYEVMYTVNGPVFFDRQYRSLDGLRTKDKTLYGAITRKSIAMYTDSLAVHPCHKETYFRKLRLALENRLFNTVQDIIESSEVSQEDKQRVLIEVEKAERANRTNIIIEITRAGVTDRYCIWLRGQSVDLTYYPALPSTTRYRCSAKGGKRKG